MQAPRSKGLRAPRPWHLFVLILPYGASFGFVSVALPYEARQHGIDVDAIGAIVALAFVPHSWKFLWAPVVDSVLNRKTWYLIALALVASGTFASAALPVEPSSLKGLTVVVVASQVGLSLLGMSCEGLIGRAMSTEHTGTASAWFQAGNFLGLGVGGGAAIELASRMGGRAGGAVLAALLSVCAFPLLLFDDPHDANRRSLSEALAALGRDLRELGRSRAGLTAAVLFLSPIGSGAASNLFGAMADEWHASLHLVALTTGSLGGVVSAAGAASGMLVINRMRRTSAYVLGGALTSFAGALMAVAPYTPLSYASFTLAYQFFNGFSFAAFSALAFETVGRGAVVTKYNLLASLANLSIAYATRLDARAHGRWGGQGVLLTDAALTCVAIVVCVLCTRATAVAQRLRAKS